MDFTNNTAMPTSSGVPDFSELGVLLLELWFGQPIQEQPCRQQYPLNVGNANSAFDLTAAMEWSKELEYNTSPDYHMAVTWCLSSSKVIVDSSKWRYYMYENVVYPVEMCHKFLSDGFAS